MKQEGLILLITIDFTTLETSIQIIDGIFLFARCIDLPLI